LTERTVAHGGAIVAVWSPLGRCVAARCVAG
jgi:hypothetical protein